VLARAVQAEFDANLDAALQDHAVAGFHVRSRRRAALA
jgi:hypothetical protein